MKTQEEIQKFIQLRAQGYSFDKIAKKMKISKSTLLKWSRKYALEIANARSCGLEALRQRYCLSPEAKVQMWGYIVDELMAEIADRRLGRLANVTTERLFNMLMKAQEKLEKSYVEPLFISEEEIEEYHQLQEVIASFQELDSLQSSNQKHTKTALKLHQNYTEIVPKLHQKHTEISPDAKDESDASPQEPQVKVNSC
jgi:hypothetical protein